MQPVSPQDRMDPQELERAGEWARAARLYRERSEAALREGSIVDLLQGLNGSARMLQMESCWEEAEETAMLSWTIAERHGLERQVVRAMNVLAVIRCSQQDTAGAAELWKEALTSARDVGDQLMVGMICQNLGVVANIHGDLREARVLYLECIAASIGADNKSAAMTAYNNLGMVCSDLEEWMEAEIYFGRGIEIAEQVGDAAMLVKLYGNRAEPLIHVGDFGRARESLDQTEARAIQLDDRRALADVCRDRAMLARLEGAHRSAEMHLECALKIAEEAALELEKAETLEEMAQLRWAEGRLGAARVTIREALRIFRQLDARWDIARLERIMAGWDARLEEATAAVAGP